MARRSVGRAQSGARYTAGPATGLLATQETLDSSGHVTATIQDGYNNFDQLASYTGASRNPTTCTYDADGLIQALNDGDGNSSKSRRPVTVEIYVDGMAGRHARSINPRRCRF